MAAGGDLAEARVGELLARQQACIGECFARLAQQGQPIRSWTSLTAEEREALRVRFRRELFPLLTPRAITQSPGHPFPVIPALTLSVAVALQDERTGPIHFAYLRLPPDLPRFVELPAGAGWVPVEQVVLAHLALLYPDRTIEDAALFRVTRKGDLDIEEAAAGDLLQAIEEELDQRSVNPVVRLELQQGIGDLLRSMLIQELRFGGGHGAAVGDLAVHETAGFMAPGGLNSLVRLPVPGGLFPPFAGRDPLRADRSLWDQVRERDILVHHPYDDFSATVLRLLDEAASDPAVVAIKMTLYRAGERSPVVDALVRAAASGKQVAAFVELKASYDEARNIGWVKQLERAGAEVVYGLVGLKNHGKVALVVRREEDGVRQYAHIGTGNYNAGTARLYTDLGLLTADPAIGDDLGDLFNQLTGTSGAPTAALRRLLVAPQHLLPALLERIAREAAHARAGRPARIRAKLNGLDDPEVIRALYAASEAGVEVDLIVRGVCTLKPGVPGLSSRIRVRGSVGRFLEHARIYHFADGGADDYLIASADWRSRNLRRRVEVAAPVLDPVCRAAARPRAGARARRPIGLGARRGRELSSASQPSGGRPRHRAGPGDLGDVSARSGGGCMDRLTRACSGAVSLVLGAAFGLAAQTAAPPTPGGGDSVVVTPGAHYRAGGFHTLFFGKHYRNLWTTPIRVEVLDLATFAGGLRPTKRGGGKQTRSLRFAGADGREYQFRSVDKDPSPLLPEELRHTVAQRVFQDQISAGHPAAPLVVSPLLDAAGVLHSSPRLVLLPDDPALGEFRPSSAVSSE